MNGNLKSALGLAVALAGLLSASGPGYAAVILGGKGAPQSEACKAAGGTESGQMCVLESGQACQSMALASENKCVDEDGNVVDEGLDTGSNLPAEESEGGSDY